MTKTSGYHKHELRPVFICHIKAQLFMSLAEQIYLSLILSNYYDDSTPSVVPISLESDSGTGS